MATRQSSNRPRRNETDPTLPSAECHLEAVETEMVIRITASDANNILSYLGQRT